MYLHSIAVVASCCGAVFSFTKLTWELFFICYYKNSVGYRNYEGKISPPFRSATQKRTKKPTKQYLWHLHDPVTPTSPNPKPQPHICLIDSASIPDMNNFSFHQECTTCHRLSGLCIRSQPGVPQNKTDYYHRQRGWNMQCFSVCVCARSVCFSVCKDYTKSPLIVHSSNLQIGAVQCPLSIFKHITIWNPAFFILFQPTDKPIRCIPPAKQISTYTPISNAY